MLTGSLFTDGGQFQDSD